jgi:cation transport regulator ChaC
MIRVFSYGSNGTAQLRARVQNPALRSRPARVEHFARIFCLRSHGWGGGGVASLHPCAGATTYGAVVELTEAELGLLDRYEGGYSRQRVEAQVRTAEGAEEVGDAVVYIADNSEMRAPPTEQYLTAIHLMYAPPRGGGLAP